MSLADEIVIMDRERILRQGVLQLSTTPPFARDGSYLGTRNSSRLSEIRCPTFSAVGSSDPVAPQS